MSDTKALALQAAINAILDQAKAEPDDVRVKLGSVNWGDLGCTAIEERRDLLLPNVPAFLVAIIEECAPGAKLGQYVLDRLPPSATEGLPAVYIELEW